MLPLIRLGSVDSTQAFLGRHPELGFCGVMADLQAAGRGRGENRWEAASGTGLCLSAALPVPDLNPGLVPQRAMLAVIEALEPCGVALGLKWPNDLVAWKEGRLVKVGGILGEHKGNRILLGLGVNLTAAPELGDRPIPPASLAELGARVMDREGLARVILEHWEDLTVTRVPSFRWPETGDTVAWEAGQGTVEDWLEDGRLRVRTAEGVLDLTGGDLRGLSPRSMPS
ncbi:MAG TPA: hypothetical protein PLC09_03845 [Holophaga sp.]|nr:hypothetical protein [Holophaga sp.]